MSWSLFLKSGLTKCDWKVVAQWATKDSNLVAQQWLVVAQQCRARNGGMWRVNYKSKNRHIYLYVELFSPQSNRKVSLSNSKVIKVWNSKVSEVIVSNSFQGCRRWWKLRVYSRECSWALCLVTRQVPGACFLNSGCLLQTVARRILPRQVLVARHFKVVVPGVREDD